MGSRCPRAAPVSPALSATEGKLLPLRTGGRTDCPGDTVDHGGGQHTGHSQTWGAQRGSRDPPGYGSRGWQSQGSGFPADACGREMRGSRGARAWGVRRLGLRCAERDPTRRVAEPARACLPRVPAPTEPRGSWGHTSLALHAALGRAAGGRGGRRGSSSPPWEGRSGQGQVTGDSVSPAHAKVPCLWLPPALTSTPLGRGADRWGSSAPTGGWGGHHQGRGCTWPRAGAATLHQTQLAGAGQGGTAASGGWKGTREPSTAAGTSQNTHQHRGQHGATSLCFRSD